MRHGKMIFTAAAILLFLSGCNKQAEVAKAGETKENEGIQIMADGAKVRDIKDKIKLVGVVSAFEQTNVFSKASGKLVKYNVEEGSAVNKDDIIAYVDRDEPGFDFAQSPIKSPVSGMVLKRFVDVGNTISPAMGSTAMATPLMIIGNISKVKVQVSIIEEDLARVKKGQEVEALLESFPGKLFQGTVDNVSPMADPLSHASKVDILIENPDNLIKPGVSAEVNIVVGVHGGVVAIPKEALVRKLNEQVVFVVGSGTVEKRRIETGFDDGSFIEVKKGLKAGEKIAMSDFNVLQDGLKVNIAGTVK